jgi:protein-disulfide isomerase
MEAFLSVIITACAVIITGVYVSRAIGDNGTAGPKGLEYLEGWEDLQRGHLTMGQRSAPVRIIEFADFQCPHCRTFHNAFTQVVEEAPGTVLLEFYHFPLSSHKVAEPAARAAECAGEQGVFQQMTAALFSEQSRLGETRFPELAGVAGVVDLAVFDSCMVSDDTRKRVAADRALGKELSIPGTPTVIINGWLYSSPPTENLSAVVGIFLAGKTPSSR